MLPRHLQRLWQCVSRWAKILTRYAQCMQTAVQGFSGNYKICALSWPTGNDTNLCLLRWSTIKEYTGGLLVSVYHHLVVFFEVWSPSSIMNSTIITSISTVLHLCNFSLACWHPSARTKVIRKSLSEWVNMHKSVAFEVGCAMFSRVVFMTCLVAPRGLCQISTLCPAYDTSSSRPSVIARL